MGFTFFGLLLLSVAGQYTTILMRPALVGFRLRGVSSGVGAHRPAGLRWPPRFRAIGVSARRQLGTSMGRCSRR